MFRYWNVVFKSPNQNWKELPQLLFLQSRFSCIVSLFCEARCGGKNRKWEKRSMEGPIRAARHLARPGPERSRVISATHATAKRGTHATLRFPPGFVSFHFVPFAIPHIRRPSRHHAIKGTGAICTFGRRPELVSRPASRPVAIASTKVKRQK